MESDSSLPEIDLVDYCLRKAVSFNLYKLKDKVRS